MRHINHQQEYRNAVDIAKSTTLPTPPWASEQSDLPPNFIPITRQCIDVYFQYKKANGTMRGIGWWQTANGYTAIALRDKWSGDHLYYSSLWLIIRQCATVNVDFINEFNDDTLWWALCCSHMVDIGGHWWFLQKATNIWQYIRKSSLCRAGEVFFNGVDMEGAVYWTSREGEDHINAISTGLFAELSVRLAIFHGAGQYVQHASDGSEQQDEAPENQQSLAEEYLEAARCSLGWILRCRYRPRKAVVLDHIELKKQRAVDWTFTYNTGVAIGTCALLYEATREDEYLHLACYMANKSMRRKGWVEDNGVLTEHGVFGKGTHDPLKNNDSVGFKSVLVRQLGTLYEVIVKMRPDMAVARETAALIKTFININMRSQIQRNTNGNGQYGPWWNGPFDTPTSHSQMAVLDVMAAVHVVNR